jgi:hypothetical protein
MMRTDTRAPECWIVDVEDGGNLEMSMPGYRKRFTFTGDEAATLAWACCARAENAGFKSSARKAKRV